jgi:xylan 1,4-beta-xylosidase
MRTIEVDFGKGRGPIRPLQGVNNGPIGYGSLVDVSHHYRALGVPYVRLHDPNWPHPREVDTPQVFPDPEADPDDPASYRFGPTDDYLQRILDTGAAIVYRLGVSIEHTPVKYYTHPPADFARWARVCAGIVRHYNHGWANGFRHGIRYWEIWNEPDIGDKMWSGTFEQYLELYRATAPVLKALDSELRVGGYAAANPRSERVGQFLSYCRQHRLPLDFFSWHTYTDDPERLAENARRVREQLDAQGFSQTESHLNEWNYVGFDWGQIWRPGNEEMRREAFELQKGRVGASFCAAALTVLQDASVDVCCYYDGQPSALFCGLFDYYGVPTLTYRAFAWFRQALDCGERAAVTQGGKVPRLYALAAFDRERRAVVVLLSHPGDGELSLEIALRGLPPDRGWAWRVSPLPGDEAREPVRAPAEHAKTRRVRMTLGPHSVALVEVEVR